MKKAVWVSPTQSGEWKVQTKGAGRAAAIVPTQSQAIDRAKDIAKRNHAELVVQGENGRIREKNSYGHDPRRTKG